MESDSRPQQAIDKWLRGIPYEVAFWNNTFRWKRTFRGMMHWSNYGSQLRLEGFDATAFFSSLPSSRLPRVLDVGSGLSYDVGDKYVCEGHEQCLDVHYVDPLAPYFNRILQKYKKPLPAIEFGMVEYLSAFFPGHAVDLVIVQNALDHSSSPLKGIFECLDTLRIGGVLYLNHHPDEAETEDYKGFHQYNINIEDDDLVIWNKAGKTHVSRLLDGLATVEVCRMDNGHVVAVCRKLREVPPQRVDDKGDKRRLASLLLAHTTLGDRLRYLFYNAIQFVVQALPWETRMRLKRLIGQTPSTES